MTQSGAVAIAIVDLGRGEEVAACLASLTRSVFTDFEVIVIENGGAKAFDRLCAEIGKPPFAAVEPGGPITWCADAEREKIPVVRWKRFRAPGGQPVLALEATDNLGYAGGVNLAIRALGKVPGWRGVWVLNPDTEADPHALEQLVRHAESGDYGLVGSRLIATGNNRVQSRGAGWRKFMGRGLALGLGEPADAPVDVPALEARLQWIGGASIYAKREYIETVGLMEEKYFLYCEDVEWALRRGKYKLGYAHDSIVAHVGGTTTGSAMTIGQRSSFSVYLAERNKLVMTHDMFPGIYPLVVLITFALLADYAVRGNWRVFSIGFRGWWAGVRGETGRPDVLLPARRD